MPAVSLSLGTLPIPLGTTLVITSGNYVTNSITATGGAQFIVFSVGATLPSSVNLELKIDHSIDGSTWFERGGGFAPANGGGLPMIAMSIPVGSLGFGRGRFTVQGLSLTSSYTVTLA